MQPQEEGEEPPIARILCYAPDGVAIAGSLDVFASQPKVTIGRARGSSIQCLLPIYGMKHVEYVFDQIQNKTFVTCYDHVNGASLNGVQMKVMDAVEVGDGDVVEMCGRRFGVECVKGPAPCEEDVPAARGPETALQAIAVPVGGISADAGCAPASPSGTISTLPIWDTAESEVVDPSEDLDVITKQDPTLVQTSNEPSEMRQQSPKPDAPPATIPASPGEKGTPPLHAASPSISEPTAPLLEGKLATATPSTPPTQRGPSPHLSDPPVVRPLFPPIFPKGIATPAPATPVRPSYMRPTAASTAKKRVRGGLMGRTASSESVPSVSRTGSADGLGTPIQSSLEAPKDKQEPKRIESPSTPGLKPMAADHTDVMKPEPLVLMPMEDAAPEPGSGDTTRGTVQDVNTLPMQVSHSSGPASAQADAEAGLVASPRKPPQAPGWEAGEAVPKESVMIHPPAAPMHVPPTGPDSGTEAVTSPEQSVQDTRLFGVKVEPVALPTEPVQEPITVAGAAAEVSIPSPAPTTTPEPAPPLFEAPPSPAVDVAQPLQPRRGRPPKTVAAAKNVAATAAATKDPKTTRTGPVRKGRGAAPAAVSDTDARDVSAAVKTDDGTEVGGPGGVQQADANSLRTLGEVQAEMQARRMDGRDEAHPESSVEPAHGDGAKDAHVSGSEVGIDGGTASVVADASVTAKEDEIRAGEGSEVGGGDAGPAATLPTPLGVDALDERMDVDVINDAGRVEIDRDAADAGMQAEPAGMLHEADGRGEAGSGVEMHAAVPSPAEAEDATPSATPDTVETEAGVPERPAGDVIDVNSEVLEEKPAVDPVVAVEAGEKLAGGEPSIESEHTPAQPKRSTRGRKKKNEETTQKAEAVPVPAFDEIEENDDDEEQKPVSDKPQPAAAARAPARRALRSRAQDPNVGVSAVQADDSVAGGAAVVEAAAPTRAKKRVEKPDSGGDVDPPVKSAGARRGRKPKVVPAVESHGLQDNAEEGEDGGRDGTMEVDTAVELAPAPERADGSRGPDPETLQQQQTHLAPPPTRASRRRNPTTDTAALTNPEALATASLPHPTAGEHHFAADDSDTTVAQRTRRGKTSVAASRTASAEPTSDEGAVSARARRGRKQDGDTTAVVESDVETKPAASRVTRGRKTQQSVLEDGGPGDVAEVSDVAEQTTESDKQSGEETVEITESKKTTAARTTRGRKKAAPVPLSAEMELTESSTATVSATATAEKENEEPVNRNADEETGDALAESTHGKATVLARTTRGRKKAVQAGAADAGAASSTEVDVDDVPGGATSASTSTATENDNEHSAEFNAENEKGAGVAKSTNGKAVRTTRGRKKAEPAAAAELKTDDVTTGAEFESTEASDAAGEKEDEESSKRIDENVESKKTTAARTTRGRRKAAAPAAAVSQDEDGEDGADAAAAAAADKETEESVHHNDEEKSDAPMESKNDKLTALAPTRRGGTKKAVPVSAAATSLEDVERDEATEPAIRVPTAAEKENRPDETTTTRPVTRGRRKNVNAAASTTHDDGALASEDVGQDAPAAAAAAEKENRMDGETTKRPVTRGRKKTVKDALTTSAETDNGNEDVDMQIGNENVDGAAGETDDENLVKAAAKTRSKAKAGKGAKTGGDGAVALAAPVEPPVRVTRSMAARKR